MELLASCQHGCTEAILPAHGYTAKREAAMAVFAKS
jgi:hypothetical protein